MAALLRNVRAPAISNIINLPCLHSRLFLQQATNPATLTCSFSKNTKTRNYGTQNVDIKVVEKRASLDQALYRMDMDVRRTGRISKVDVMKIYDQIKSLGSATATQSLLLIRCCGSLLAEDHPEKRSELINTIWKELAAQGSLMDVSHYNALLKVYIENAYQFSSSDFLAEMESKKIEPNRVTYQRFIEKYCQEGDIEGAGKILQIMKDKDMAVNELVFNALIIGHARANDMEGAKNVIEVMSNANLEPSADTYTNLVCAYAEKGDIHSIREILADLEKTQLSLNNSNYFSVIRSLSKYGYVQHIDEVLSKCPKSVGYNQDSINNIMDLMNHGYEEVAYKLLQAMPNNRKITEENAQASGHFFLRHLVNLNKPVEEIAHYCDKLKKDEINSYGLAKVTEMAFLLKKPAMGIQLVQKLIETGMDVRPHFFWPALTEARRNKDSKAIFDVLQMMTQANCTVTYDTFLDYIIPALDASDPVMLTQKLKESTGYSITSIVNPMVTHLLFEKRLKEAADVVSVYPAALNGYNVVRLLAGFSSPEENFEYIFKIMERVRNSSNFRTESREKSDWCGSLLLDVFNHHNLKIAELEPFIRMMLSKNMNISQTSLDILYSRIKTEVPSQLSELLEQLVTSDVEPVLEEADNIPHPRDMSIDELETHYIELKSKNMNTRGVIRKLIMQHCRYKNLDRVTTLLAEGEKIDFDLPSAVLSSLIDLYTHHGNLEEAMKIKNNLDETDPYFPIDDYKLVNLATLLTTNDRIDDAIELLKSHHSKGLIRSRNMSLQRNLWRLLNVPAEKADVEGTQKLFDVIQECEFCPISNLILGPLVKSYIYKEDLDGAIKKFEECCTQYKNTPWKNELLIKLIKKEDTANIKKIMDLSSEIHGEMNVLYDLAFAFNESGKLNQAKKILETPGLRAKFTRLDPICERYLQMNMITELENIIKITRDLFGLDRDRMYFYLLRAYCKREDVDKALSIWTSLQEENIQPSARTLKFLANFLQKHDQPVPFVLPETVPTNYPINDHNEALRESIRINDLDEALDIKRILEVEGHKLSTSLSSQLLKSLVSASRINDARNLVNEMLSNNMYPFPKIFRLFTAQFANAGDVASLEELKPLLPQVLLRGSGFSSIVGNAYINSGRHLEFLENLEKNVDGSKDNFPLSSIILLLQKHPETEERVMTLAKKLAAEQEYMKPLNMVWIHYFCSNKYDLADNLLAENPGVKSNMLFMAAVDDIIKTADEEKAQKLIEIVNSCNISERLRIAPVGAFIVALVKNNKTDEALVQYETAISKGALNTDFSLVVLKTLKTALQNEGKEVAFNIPTRMLNRRQNNQVDSSSSSDSSSDDEK